MVTIQDDMNGASYVSSTKSIVVSEATEDAKETWQSTVETELTTRMPIDDPLVRVRRLIRKAGATSVVVVTFHHAIADGISAVAFLNDIVNAINGLDLPPGKVRPCAEDLLLGPRVDQGLVMGETLPRKEDLLERGSQPLWRQFKTDKVEVNGIQLDKKHTLALHTRCRRESTTIHAAICAAVTSANAGPTADAPYRIQSPINTRRLINVENSEIGVYFTSAMTWVYPKVDVSFWERARTISNELHYWRSIDQVVRGAQTLEYLFPTDATPKMASGLFGWLSYDVIVSNLGKIEGQSGPKATLTSVWGPMVLGRIQNERMIGAASLGDSLYLTETKPLHVRPSLHEVAAILEWAGIGPTSSRLER
jgi:NRPS condensation-like uncharacterized protein